jgi:hypothetical protein
MTLENPHPAIAKLKSSTGGAVGAGLVLVVLPCIALYFGIGEIGKIPTVGLPILAIFGIMVLFGSLALVSTLFARLSLSDPTQALALPEGSIRAAIALALIVLFAIIAIMLDQSMSKPYVIPGLDQTQVETLVRNPVNNVLAVVPECRATPEGPPGPVQGCPPENVRYSVHLVRGQTKESTDLAKQLLILIGTLMTSVTSFYFASRASEAKREQPTPEEGGEGKALVTSGSSAAQLDESDVDGCDVAVVSETADEELPAARGGVA